MPFLNSVTLLGHLAADPEIRRLEGGHSVARFTVAVNRRRQDGKPQVGEFFACEVWDGWAENLVKTARKGALVIVMGRLQQDRWTDRETQQPRSVVKVRASQAIHVVCQYSGEPGSADIPEAEEAASPALRE